MSNEDTLKAHESAVVNLGTCLGDGIHLVGSEIR